MCTVSFLPARDGFHLATNRDELRARPIALPPEMEVFPDGAGRAVYPREPGGGTWVAVNAAGLAFALLNWYSHPAGAATRARSRGEIIPALASAEGLFDARERLARLRVGEMGPFRLVIVSRRERRLQETRSGGDGSTQTFVHRWQRTHWFSSSADERKANLRRQETCRREAWVCPPNGTDWLRGLHASHHPSRGPFSICMHRAEARTVSYTEISVDAAGAVMRYAPGPPCEQDPSWQVTLVPNTADAAPTRPRHVLPG